jgi:hypothetical protein
MINRINLIFDFSFAHFTEKFSLSLVEFRLQDFIRSCFITPNMEFE